MVDRALRFWTWYWLAWVPYLGIALLAFASSGEMPFPAAVAGALVNVAPQALFGVAVVHLCRRNPWTPESPGRFFAIQAGFAITYALLAVAVESVSFVTIDSIRRGELTLASFNPGIAIWQFAMSLFLYLAIAGITYSIDTQGRLYREQERSARARALQTEAELTALRAQLNPHFLFNTLHTLLALVREDSSRAEKALEQFGDLLRYALRVQQETIDEGPFEQEWKFVSDYLALEQLRLGERLRLELDVHPETLDCVVPVFCLQPLVENAVRHGIAPRAGGGRLGIDARLENGHVVLRVEDDGGGADFAAVTSGGGMGLRLVRQRLEALHGDRGELTIEPRPAGGGFAVRVQLPAREES